MHHHLQRALDSMDAATRGLTRKQFISHPEGKWCAAEILEHLSLAFGSTAKLLNKHLASGQPATTPRTLKHRLLQAVVIQMGYFPSGREAPSFTLPSGLDPEAALQTFRENLSAMDQAITACEARFGRTTPIASHFIFGPLTAGDWRKFHWVHTRHHMKQIRQRRQFRP